MAASKRLRVTALGVLQAFIGIGAIPAGIILILDPSGAQLGMRVEALDGSPFPDYLIPGLFLLVVNGLGSVVGAVATFRRHPRASLIAVGLGAFLMVWIVVQVASLGLPIHWLQALYFALGAVELGLGWQIGPSSARKEV